MEDSLIKISYGGGSIDRAAVFRTDKNKVEKFLTCDDARFIPFWQRRNLFNQEPTAQVVHYRHISSLLDDGTNPIFLGLYNQTPWFAIKLPDGDAPPTLGVDGEFLSLQQVVTLLSEDEAALLCYARGMIIWHENHGYCSRCGKQSISGESGHIRTCTDETCGHKVFPRTDPAVITIITDPLGDHCLLGRQKHWPDGMHSLIAGFVEPGESLEDAVAREALEETGIRVVDVRYQGSQPWPFPSSIMLGFSARAVNTDIHLHDNELEFCDWFTREELSKFGEMSDNKPGRKLPNRNSIARHLIQSWFDDKT